MYRTYPYQNYRCEGSVGFRVILIGPITAFAELENRIADKETARIKFLVNIMTPYL